MTETTVTEHRAQVTCPCGCKHKFTVRYYQGFRVGSEKPLSGKEARKIAQYMDAAFDRMSKTFEWVFNRKNYWRF